MNIENKREKTEQFAALALSLLILTGLALYACFVPEPEAAVVAAPGMENEYEGIIRFHVIANSDSEEDQALKLQVRNSVVMKVQNALMGCTDIAETRTYIEENLDLIEEWTLDSVKGWGYDYEVKARLGVSAIPARQYDDLYFPAGNYEALTITIGEGKGRNWWCVLFPPLCLVDVSDEAYGELFGEDAEGRLVLRSRLLEILGKYNEQKKQK